MTLARQIFWFVSVLFLVIFLANFWNSLAHTRDYLRLQLTTNSQDTATSLGLSIRPYLIDGDMAGMQSLVDIIFDRGYYQEIYLQNMDGNPIVRRVQDLRVAGVPEWFVMTIPLEVPAASTLITSGWHQAGELWVTSHPGHAYEQLWRQFKKDLFRMVVAYGLALLIATTLIAWLTRPLRAVERLALGIAERHFDQLETIPKTRELGRVVTAMNHMSGKLKLALEELTEYADSMRIEAFSDHLTGLNNLRRFEATLDKLLRSEESGLQGAVAKLELEGFGQLCEQHGFEAGELALKDVAALLEMTFEGFPGAMPARIGSTEFAVLLPNSSATEAASFGARLRESAMSLSDRIQLNVGIACYTGGMRAGSVMGHAASALETARAKDERWALMASDEARSDQKDPAEWREMLLHALSNKNIEIVLQPIRDCREKKTLYYEVLARLVGDNGELISAGAVVPLAKRLGRIQEFEQSVIQRALAFVKDYGGDINVAINLSFQSIHEPKFLDWLFAELSTFGDLCGHLVLEISEHEVALDMATSKQIVRRAHEFGVRVAVEHFGVTFAGFTYLRELKPDFVKVDGSYVRGISQDADSRSFVHALVRFAHGLDIRIIGECTEHAADFATLGKLSVDGAQGYHVGQPRALSTFTVGRRGGEAPT